MLVGTLSFIVYFFAACSFTVKADNPGIQITATERGLNTVKEVVVEKLEEHIESMTLSSKAGNPSFRNFDIEAFDFGNSTKLQLASPNVLTPSIHVDRLSISADMQYKAWGFFKISKRIRLTVARTSITQVIYLHADASGRPAVTAGHCEVKINDLAVTAADGNGLVNVLFNLVSSIFERYAETELQKQICSTLSRKIIAETNEISSKMKVNFPLFGHNMINLALLRDPVATDHDVTAFVRGRCFPSLMTDPESFNLNVTAPALPPLTSTKKMLSLIVSDYVLNTLLYSMWRNNDLRVVLSQSKIEEHLKTNIHIGTIATYFPEFRPYVGKEASIQIVLSPSSAPSAFFEVETGITLNGTYNFIMNAIVADQGPKYAVLDTNPTVAEGPQHVLTIQTNVKIQAQAEILSDRVVGTVTHLSVTPSGSRPNNAHAVRWFNRIVQAAIPTLILPRINDVAASGFMLPEYFNFMPKKPSLEFKEHALVITSDFSHTETN